MNSSAFKQANKAGNFEMGLGIYFIGFVPFSFLNLLSSQSTLYFSHSHLMIKDFVKKEVRKKILMI
jgi:hypothetical protein